MPPGPADCCFLRVFDVFRVSTSISSKRIAHLPSILKCARVLPKPLFYQRFSIVFAESILQVMILNDTLACAASYTIWSAGECLFVDGQLTNTKDPSVHSQILTPYPSIMQRKHWYVQSYIFHTVPMESNDF